MNIIAAKLFENILSLGTITAFTKKVALSMFLLAVSTPAQFQDYVTITQNISYISQANTYDNKANEINIYYQNNHYKPIWIENNKISPKAIKLLHYAESKYFFKNNQSKYLYNSVLSATNTISPASLAWFDYSFSYLLSVYAQEHLYGYIDPENDLKSHHIKAKNLDIDKLLSYCKSQNNALSIISMLENINPEQKLLEELSATNKYSTIVTYNDSTDKPVTLSHAQINELIEINLERSKWLPPLSQKKYIKANIPEFSLSYFSDDGKSIANMKIIAGRPTRKTPIFSDNLSYIELNPKWNVPRKIIREDFKPKLLKNPNALSAKGIRIYDSWKPDASEINPATISWSEYKNKKIPYRFTQDAGDENSLGKVKLMFPNPYDIYIHGTPEKYLFSKPSRAYSSGCIRVENPEKLASNIMDGYRGWDLKRINSILSSRNNKVLTPKNKIPVYITYQTAKADAEDTLYVYKDIYNYDEQISKALEKHRKEYLNNIEKQTNALNLIAIRLISSELNLDDFYKEINPFKEPILEH